MKRRILIPALLALLAPGAHAGNRFSSDHFVLELPAPNWQCHQDSSNWVCRDRAAAGADDPLIALVAERRPNADSLGGYLDSFRRPQDGAQVRYAKKLVINQQVWIDAVQDGGQHPGRATRYLLTLGPKLKYTVTISAAREKFDALASQLEKTVASLRARESKSDNGPPRPKPGDPQGSINRNKKGGTAE